MDHTLNYSITKRPAWNSEIGNLSCIDRFDSYQSWYTNISSFVNSDRETETFYCCFLRSCLEISSATINALAESHDYLPMNMLLLSFWWKHALLRNQKGVRNILECVQLPIHLAYSLMMYFLQSSQFDQWFCNIQHHYVLLKDVK